MARPLLNPECLEVNEDTPGIMRELGELKGTQNAILSLLTKVDQRLDNHSERIVRLEKSRAWLVGVAVSAGYIINNYAMPLTALLHK